MSETSYREISYQDILVGELTKRKKKNNSFSLRSFARYLAISPAQLSSLISGKRKLSAKQAFKIANKLDLSPEDRLVLLKSVAPGVTDEAAVSDRKVLTDDQFNLIADWYHYAILSLGDLPRTRANAKWIAKRIGVDEITALAALQRLKRMGLLEILPDGSFRQVTPPLDTAFDVPSAALRKHHRQNLELAAEKLDTVDVLLREFNSLTLAVNLSNLPRVKKLINEVKLKIAAELERGEKQEVYVLSIQLFPVTQIETNQTKEKK